MKKNWQRKRIVRRFRLAIGVVLLSRMPVSAQKMVEAQFYPAPDSEVGQFAVREQKMYKTLKLTPDQLKQIDGINDVYVVKIVKIKSDKSTSKLDKKSLRRAAKAERDTQFKSILTETQRKIWNKLRQVVAVRKAKKMDKKGQLPQN